MSYGDFGRVAPPKPSPPARSSGVSSGCAIATFLACVGTGVVFLGALSCGLIGFIFYRASENARAEQSARIAAESRLADFPQFEPIRFEPPPPMEMPNFEPRPMPTFEPAAMPPMPDFPEPTLPEPMFRGPMTPGEFRPPGAPFGPGFEPGRFEPPSFEPPQPFSSSSRPSSGSLKIVPVSFTTSSVDPLPEATRRAREASEEPGSPGGDFAAFHARHRAALLRDSVEDIATAGRHLGWLVRERERLPEELADEIARSVEAILLNAEGASDVRHVPALLAWYREDNLSALVETMGRLSIAADAEGADASRRQILVGAFHRYVTVDTNWTHTAAPDLLRVVARSTTLSPQFVPAILELPLPYPEPMQDLLVEFAFDDTTAALVVQRRAMGSSGSRKRLLNEALARLESTDDTQREAAYLILSVADACPSCRPDVVDALARAFANEAVEPSPEAHAALLKWVDRDSAARFADFRDSESPVARFAARATLDRYAIGP